ncbi:substrate import-associated zinc metallohydrolase lipoprotein [Arcicella aurantiaca]|uniref:Substrate import-associated zinc metallohydrolase lipoprotein n=1 Tax=Arcicella aurantiaca TaxID=591202 RepID=A0A316EDY4_9BACT|nr:putative zinc-binding metallopeptidase [Arcicella aurantiaca]PWK27842.1 substrate import-associated zinc metallohydrolase lipoprotein [Arcicella aurantiaca]
MKKTFINISLFALIMSILCACNSTVEDLSPKVDGLGGDVYTKQPLDNWIEQTFTKPYNIEVKYRWDPYEVPLDKTLVPPLVAKVQPTMEAVKAIWIDPYEQEAGSDFIKKFCPKQYVLVGSANWNTNGTIVLGTAEGGRKVVLYVINDFDKKNVEGVKQMLHTIHHEFGHILHQNILYPLSFKQITPGSYTSNWYNVSDSEALAAGYITPYSMNGPDEDFVEILSTMLVEGKTGFDALVNSSTTTAGKAAIRQKEQIVVDYLKKSYNIDFKSLQTRTQTAIINFTK